MGEWLRILTAYTLEGRAHRITSPTLVIEGDGDFATESDRAHEALSCKKTLKKLSAEQGRGGHCRGLRSKSGST